MSLALLILALAGACAGPTARDTSVDTRAQERAAALKSPVRPAIQPAKAENPSPVEYDTLVRALSSAVALERLKASSRLGRAGAAGVLAAAAFSADTDYGENALKFVGRADPATLSPEQQAEIRNRCVPGLASTVVAIRVAAAEVFQRLGPGAHDGEFVNAIFDAERRVRWFVVRRFSDQPLELQPTHLLRLVEALADVKAPAAIRADVIAVLLQQHQRRSDSSKPPSYDPYKDPGAQGGEISAWRAWAATIR